MRALPTGDFPPDLHLHRLAMRPALPAGGLWRPLCAAACCTDVARESHATDAPPPAESQSPATAVRRLRNCPGPVDSFRYGLGRGCGVCACLLLDRGEPSEATLPPPALVGALDPGDDQQPELFSSRPAVPVEHGRLEIMVGRHELTDAA